MMPLRRSFFKLFNDSVSGSRCSWTRAAFSAGRGEKREKWEKHLPPHAPDTQKSFLKKSRGRQREGYGEKRSSVFYDRGACCGTAFKMLLTGSRWEEETQVELRGQDTLSGPARKDTLTNAQRASVVWGLCCVQLHGVSHQRGSIKPIFLSIIITWLLSKLRRG